MCFQLMPSTTPIEAITRSYNALTTAAKSETLRASIRTSLKQSNFSRIRRYAMTKTQSIRDRRSSDAQPHGLAASVIENVRHGLDRIRGRTFEHDDAPHD